MVETFEDQNGYLRNSETGRLLHREIAFQTFNHMFFENAFSDYEVHHKNGDKQDNNPSNLQILTTNEHRKIHGLSELKEESLPKISEQRKRKIEEWREKDLEREGLRSINYLGFERRSLGFDLILWLIGGSLAFISTILFFVLFVI